MQKDCFFRRRPFHVEAAGQRALRLGRQSPRYNARHHEARGASRESWSPLQAAMDWALAMCRAESGHGRGAQLFLVVTSQEHRTRWRAWRPPRTPDWAWALMKSLLTSGAWRTVTPCRSTMYKPKTKWSMPHCAAQQSTAQARLSTDADSGGAVRSGLVGKLAQRASRSSTPRLTTLITWRCSALRQGQVRSTTSR